MLHSNINAAGEDICLELEMVSRKILKEKEEMTRKGERYLSEKEALATP